VLAYQRTGGARMVEVDVREQQVAEVVKLEPVLGEARLQRGDTARRAAVLECRPVGGLEQVAADDALMAAVEEVERLRRRHALILRTGAALPRSG
jgi:hypothetical protein